MKFRILLPFGTFWDVNTLGPKYFKMIQNVAYSFDAYKSWEELKENIDYDGEMAILIMNNNDSILFDGWEKIYLDEIYNAELKSESERTSEKI